MTVIHKYRASQVTQWVKYPPAIQDARALLCQAVHKPQQFALFNQGKTGTMNLLGDQTGGAHFCPLKKALGSPLPATFAGQVLTLRF